jgi:hypothetical protein
VEGVRFRVGASSKLDESVRERVEHRTRLGDVWLFQGEADPHAELIKVVRLPQTQIPVQLHLQLDVDEGIVVPLPFVDIMGWADVVGDKLKRTLADLYATAQSTVKRRQFRVNVSLTATLNEQSLEFENLSEELWVSIGLTRKEKGLGYEDWDLQVSSLDSAKGQISMALELGPGFSAGNAVRES